MVHQITYFSSESGGRCRIPAFKVRSRKRWSLVSKKTSYGCFSLDVIASMLVHRPIKKKLLWQFDSIIMQNVSHHLRLLCAPTWPSYDVIGEHLLINKSAMLHTINHRQGIRGISGGRFFSSDIWIFDQISNYCPISEMSKERFNWSEGQTSDPRVT